MNSANANKAALRLLLWPVMQPARRLDLTSPGAVKLHVHAGDEFARGQSVMARLE